MVFNLLSTEFLQALENANPGDKITGIIAWNVMTDTCKGIDLMQALAVIKKPVLATASSCNDVRVNSLDGMPQVIVEAPVESWRTIIAENTQLADEEDKDVVVQANERIFSAL